MLEVIKFGASLSSPQKVFRALLAEKPGVHRTGYLTRKRGCMTVTLAVVVALAAAVSAVVAVLDHLDRKGH